MKKKRAVWTVIIAAVVITVLLIALEAYYVAVALVIGTVIMAHRELWSLIRWRKLPPVDERVRENTDKAIRNGFIFFAIATAILMLPFSVAITDGPETVQVLAGLFLSAGLVYLLSYLYFDRAQPNMTEKRLKMLRTFLLVIVISVAVFVIGAVLHNVISGVFDFEEPVFFVIAVLLAPLALIVGLVGSLVLFITGLIGKPSS